MTEQRAPLITPVLIGGCIIIMIGFSIRASFGVFQIPIAQEFGWLRSEFSFAIAIQNLAWGIGQPIFGAIAEKVGDRKAIIAGALIYALGLVLSSYAVTPAQHQWLEILVGFGIAGTGFGVILAVVGRASSDENRSLTLGIATAAGSAGQIFGAPLAEYLLGIMPWQSVFMAFAALILLTLFALPMMRSPIRPATRAELEQSMGETPSSIDNLRLQFVADGSATVDFVKALCAQKQCSRHDPLNLDKADQSKYSSARLDSSMVQKCPSSTRQSFQ